MEYFKHTCKVLNNFIWAISSTRPLMNYFAHFCTFCYTYLTLSNVMSLYKEQIHVMHDKCFAQIKVPHALI